MSSIQEKLLCKTEDVRFETTKIREKLKASCTPAVKKTEGGKRPGPLVAKHTSEVQSLFGSSSDGVHDAIRRPCRTPSPSSNSTEFTFLAKTTRRRPLSPSIGYPHMRSPVRPRSRSPPVFVFPTTGLRKTSSQGSSLDNLQLEVIRKRVKKVQRARLYLVQRPGPNSLIIAGDSPEHKYKVIIGPQTCSCGRGPHCVHILFVMLRVFQVAENDPRLYVKNLKNFEVESLFRDYDEKRKKRVSLHLEPPVSSLRASSERTLNKGFDIKVGSRSSSMNDIRNSSKEEDHPCPICLLDMLDGESLVTCEGGCKNKLHHHCIAIWSDARKRQNEPVHCPLCRADWIWPTDHSKSSKDAATRSKPAEGNELVNGIGHTRTTPFTNPPEATNDCPQVTVTPAGGTTSLPSAAVLPAASLSCSSSSLSSNSTDTLSTVRLFSSTSTISNSAHSSLPASGYSSDQWKQVFGVDLTNGLQSRDWTVREKSLRRLCSSVVTTLSQQAQQGFANYVFERCQSNCLVNTCCNILSTLAPDPVYKVYIGCLRCLRALLAYSVCSTADEILRLQEIVVPVVQAILVKCADGNRRTSQLSVASVIELCRGQSGELAVGKRTHYPAENGIGGVSFILDCILDDGRQETSCAKWDWFLGRLNVLDRLMEDFPEEFYLLYVENLPRDGHANRNNCQYRLINYDRLISVLGFSLQLIKYPHANVCKMARRVFVVAARLTAHIPSVFAHVCDMLQPVDPVLQLKLRHRLCTAVRNVDVLANRPADSGGDNKVVYTSVHLPGRRRSAPPSPMPVANRTLILEKLGRDIYLDDCECSSKKSSRRRPSFRRSSSYNSEAQLHSLTATKPSCVRTVNDCPIRPEAHHQLQRPTYLPLLPNSVLCAPVSASSAVSNMSTADQCSCNNRAPDVVHGTSGRRCCEPAVRGYPTAQSLCLSHMYKSRAENPFDAPSQCPVGDLIDLSIPLTPETPSTSYPPLSFKSEIATPTTPVSYHGASISASSANEIALQQKKDVVYEEAMNLVQSLKRLSLQTVLPNIPGLTDTLFEVDGTEQLVDSYGCYETLQTTTTQYLEGMHWFRGPLLGTGAFSSCYQARDVKTGTIMAVKQVSFSRNTLDDQNSKMNNIHEEIVMMKKLEHPHVVRLLGATQQGSHYNMFVEWMPGGSVSALLERYGPFTDDVMVRYMHQVLAGLSYLHDNQILHRDLKGANLLVDSTGHHLRIGDFGAAARLATQRTVADEFKGQLLGTIAFMAPEVLRGEGYGRSSDVWSMGCVIIEMATTKPPWDAVNISNDLALLYKIACSQDPPPIPVSLSPGIRDVALRCLEQKSEDRPAAKELLQHPCFHLLDG